MPLLPFQNKKNRLATSQNRMRFTSPSQPTPPSRLSRSKTRKLANSKKFNPVVLLEKIPVPPQSNSSMTQDSDLFSTPKRPSKLSLSYTRKNLNCKKNYSESCNISQDLLPSSSGTSSVVGESSFTPTHSQNTLMTRETGGKTGGINFSVFP